MNDPIGLTIIAKFVLALFLIAGGILALIFGKDLYLQGVGLKHDGSIINVKKVKASLKTVGSVVMGTSVAWGFLAYLESPVLKKSNTGSISIASGGSSIVQLSAAKVHSSEPASETDARGSTPADQNALKEAFAQALQVDGSQKAVIRVNDAVATIDPKSIYVTSGPDDSALVIGKASSPKGEVDFTFKPALEGGKLAFEPKSVGLTGKGPSR